MALNDTLMSHCHNGTIDIRFENFKPDGSDVESAQFDSYICLLCDETLLLEHKDARTFGWDVDNEAKDRPFVVHGMMCFRYLKTHVINKKLREDGYL